MRTLLSGGKDWQAPLNYARGRNWFQHGGAHIGLVRPIDPNYRTRPRNLTLAACNWLPKLQSHHRRVSKECPRPLISTSALKVCFPLLGVSDARRTRTAMENLPLWSGLTRVIFGCQTWAAHSLRPVKWYCFNRGSSETVGHGHPRKRARARTVSVSRLRAAAIRVAEAPSRSMPRSMSSSSRFQIGAVVSALRGRRTKLSRSSWVPLSPPTQRALSVEKKVVKREQRNGPIQGATIYTIGS